jgi:hypothetical protein
MKRDMTLVLEILEKVTDGELDFRSIEGYDDTQVSFHRWLLVKSGFLYGSDTTSMIGKSASVSGATWKGYDLFDSLFGGVYKASDFCVL